MGIGDLALEDMKKSGSSPAGLHGDFLTRRGRADFPPEGPLFVTRLPHNSSHFGNLATVMTAAQPICDDLTGGSHLGYPLLGALRERCLCYARNVAARCQSRFNDDDALGFVKGHPLDAGSPSYDQRKKSPV